MDLIVDASVWVEALKPEGEHARGWMTGLLGDDDLYIVAGLTEIEVLNALRRATRSHRLAWADKVPARLKEFPTKWLPLSMDMLQRIWELRGNLTASDAAYVALAERVQADNYRDGKNRESALITADRAFVKAPKITCRVLLYTDLSCKEDSIQGCLSIRNTSP